MSTQTIDVAYSSLTGIRFYNSKGEQFNGDLICPSSGCTFEFRQKAGSTGWTFDNFTTARVSGPPVQFSKSVANTNISVVDPGNQVPEESLYNYTISIDTGTHQVFFDPKIKNTGGN